MSIEMISESFLRNYSIKKILNAASIEKEKLKVFYSKNIRQVIKQNQKRLINQAKPRKKKDQMQVFYRYTVKHCKSDVFRDHKSLDEHEFYRGKPKAPIRFKEINLEIKSKVHSQETKKNQKNQKTFRFFSPSPEKAYLTPNDLSRTVTSRQRRTTTGFRKKTASRNKTTNLDESDLLEPKHRNLRLDTKMEDSQEHPKICLENQQIVRCSAGIKKDNFVLSREEALKKSISRCEKLRKNIRQKYAKLGVKKTNFTEMEYSFPSKK